MQDFAYKSMVRKVCQSAFILLRTKKIVSSSFIGSTLFQLEYLWYNIEKVIEDTTNITLFTGQGVGTVSQMVLLLVLYWLHGD